jgi:hypothetical protein
MQQGRKRGDSYKRRTNAEIARDKQNEDRAAAQQAQVHKQRRETFFNPSAKSRGEPDKDEAKEDSAPPEIVAAPEAPTLLAWRRKPAMDEPLPGVNLDLVPELFHADIHQFYRAVKSTHDKKPEFSLLSVE